MEIRCVSLDHPGLGGLLRSLDAELRAMYGCLQDAYDGLNLLPEGADAFLLLVDGEAAACACLKPVNGGDGELKRVFVEPRYRGTGLAKALIGAVEDRARELGLKRLMLETGAKQAPAIGLYDGLGFVRIPNYGEYAGKESSVCMAKDL